jgi:hypothetical protein
VLNELGSNDTSVLQNCKTHLRTKIKVGFEVVTAVSMKMAVFWVVAPCSPVEVYQRFRDRCCLHHQGDEGAKNDFAYIDESFSFLFSSVVSERIT